MVENLTPAIQRAFPTETMALLKAMGESASLTDMRLYLVGGSVRDLLLERQVRDVDLVVEGNATALAFKVAREMPGEVLAHHQFGTATLKLGRQRLDLATARQETYQRPGALPQVTPSTIREDLKRRDFTINAMATHLSGAKFGELLDLHGGLKDLKAGLIRILHPRSFIDDATRMLRAVRHEQRLCFRLEEASQVLLSKAVRDGLLDTISGDRVRNEIELMLKEPEPTLPVLRAGELGILRAIYPALGDGSTVRAIQTPDWAKQPLLYLAGLAYPITPEEGEGFIQRLNMPVSWARIVRDTMSLRLSEDLLSAPNMGRADLCLFLDNLSDASIKAVLRLSTSATMRERLSLYLSEWRYVKAALNGNDIITLGALQGPQVGRMLRELRKARLEGQVSTRQEELKLIQRLLEKDSGSSQEGGNK